jgi:O-antigen/teichoic acid export membrane protein
MEIKKHIARGFAWTASARLLKQIVQFAATIVLARILSPVDFGMFALAGVFINAGLVACSLGMDTALIQKQEVGQEHLNSVFLSQVFLGAIFTTAFILVAPILSRISGNSGLIKVLKGMSLVLIMNSFGSVPDVILRKTMRFKELAVRDAWGAVVFAVAVIGLAVNGYGVFSFVIALILSSALENILLWKFARWRPSFTFSFKSIKDIIKCSMYVTGSQLTGFCVKNADIFLIGRVLGLEALGFYTLALKLACAPFGYISLIVDRVLLPVLSRVQKDIKEAGALYLQVTKHVTAVTFSFLSGIILFAPDIVTALYGDKWSPVIVLTRILGVAALTQSVGLNIHTLYNSLGSAKAFAKYVLFIALPSLIGAVMIGVKYGLYCTAFLYSLRTLIVMLILQGNANKLVKSNWIEFLKAHGINMIIAFIVVCSGAAAGMLLRDFAQIKNVSIVLSGEVAVVLLVYSMLTLKVYKPDQWIRFFSENTV